MGPRRPPPLAEDGVSMKPRAVFISATQVDGKYWANQWGYRLDEIVIVKPIDREAIESLRPDEDVPCFICGSTLYDGDGDRLRQITDHLQSRGFTILDAQEVPS